MEYKKQVVKRNLFLNEKIYYIIKTRSAPAKFIFKFNTPLAA